MRLVTSAFLATFVAAMPLTTDLNLKTADRPQDAVERALQMQRDQAGQSGHLRDERSLRRALEDRRYRLRPAAIERDLLLPVEAETERDAADDRAETAEKG
ncbi:MAG: hypothetical protein FJX46_12220 [Alphaproteobacteria bacterium]|nr:hypothetical protein [Alphaproteobacteria bacterium]